MLTLLALVLLIFVLTYYYLLKYKYNYWSRMGVKGPTPIPIIGNFGKIMTMQESIGELARKTYQQYPNEKLVGLYCGFRKVVILRDPEIIRYILIKDFKTFMNRGIRTNEEGFCNNIFAAEGEIWKSLRQILTPAFTCTKLKQMKPLVQECVDKLILEIETRIVHGNLCDIKDICEKYSLDVISSCIFGLGLEVYSNEIKHFRNVTETAFKPSLYFWFCYVAEMIIPGIQTKFTQLNPGAYLRKFFMHLVTTVIKERALKGIKRNDFMNIMIELKEQYKVNTSGTSKFKIDDNFIASQAFAFYIAGQDTSSKVLSFLLYELSLNQDIQDTVYKEICRVCDTNDGKLTFDSLKDFKYLNMVLRETMRKHTVVGFILRQADNDYIIPGTKMVLQADTLVLISLTGLHNDAKYFDDPERFNPDVFSDESSIKFPQYAYMPFGTGQRNCIGLRLAELQIIMATVAILRNYRLEPCNDAGRQIKYHNNLIALSPKNGIWASISKR